MGSPHTAGEKTTIINTFWVFGTNINTSGQNLIHGTFFNTLRRIGQLLTIFTPVLNRNDIRPPSKDTKYAIMY